jgi:PAS domain S-box-containing protein
VAQESNKSKKQLIRELEEARKKIAALEREEAERKRVEEALRVTEERYRVLFQITAEGILIADIETMEFKYANPAMCRMLGYTEEELKRMSVRDIHPKEDLEHVKSEFEAQARGEKILAPAIPCLRKDGTTMYADVNTTVVLMDGRKYNVGFFTDITERIVLQERLVRQEKLAVLGQLANGVGHELRNPLGAIKNAAYFLNMVLEKPEPEVKETLKILEKEVAASEKIINSLLDFARIRPPIKREVDIKEIMQEVLSRINVPENIEVKSQVDESFPTIMADPGQLGQVFENIILNALQAMPEGGQLIVKSEVPDPGWAAVSFVDTGVGIPQENLGKIFEPLFTSKPKGIGLGMAITKTYVEGHGGCIDVQSEVGKGSTFTVKLPI